MPGIPASVPVTIEPPLLEFSGSCPLCIPAIGTAELINLSEEEELDVHSVTSDSVHFHPPQDELQRLPPGGRMNISVVFLPRTIGLVNTSLLVQTSAGGFLYPVRGGGAPNPYRTAPILDVTVLAGSPYEPTLSIRNPHDEVMHVREVLSSEGFLHLTLPPAAEQHGAASVQELWTLEPGETKAVLALKLETAEHGEWEEGGYQGPGTYNAYVHIKTDFDTLIVPVGVTVTPQGVQALPAKLDFGTLTSEDSTMMIVLSLLSNVEPPLRVLEVRASKPNKSLRISSSPNVPDAASHELSLMPLVRQEVVHVTFSGQAQGDFSGKLRVRTDSPDPRLEYIDVPYQARVMHGSLGWTLSYTHGNTSSFSRLALKNQFKVPVAITGAAIDDPHIRITSFVQGVVLQPDGVHETLLQMDHSHEIQRIYEAPLIISSNATRLQVPVHVYHGRFAYDYAVYPNRFENPVAPEDMPVAGEGLADQVKRQQANLARHQKKAADAADADRMSVVAEDNPGLVLTHNGAVHPTAVNSKWATPLPPATLHDQDGHTIWMGTLARGAKKRVLLNMTNPNPVSLRVVALVWRPDEAAATLERSDGAPEPSKPPVAAKLHWSVQTVRNEAFMVMPTNGLVAPGDSRRVEGWYEREPWRSPEPAAVHHAPPPLFLLQPRWRAILAVDVTAQGVGAVAGTLQMRMETVPHLARATSSLDVRLVGEAIEGGATMVSTSGIQGGDTIVGNKPTRRQRLAPEARPLLAFNASIPGTTRDLPIVVLSTFDVPLNVVSVSTGLGLRGERPSAELAGGGGPAVMPQLTVVKSSWSTTNDSIIMPRQDSIVGWARLSTTEMLGSADAEYDHLADPFFHMTPGAPLDASTLSLLARRRKRWSEFAAPRRAKDLVGYVRVDTDVVRNITVPVSISFAWPSVAQETTIDVGRTSICPREVPPSDCFLVEAYVTVAHRSTDPRAPPVWVQLLDPKDPLLVKHAQHALLPSDHPFGDEAAPYRPENFHVAASAKQPHVLQRGEAVELGPVRFMPQHVGLARSWLFVRNNVTLLDQVLLSPHLPAPSSCRGLL